MRKRLKIRFTEIEIKFGRQKNLKIYRERTTVYVETSMLDVPAVVISCDAGSEKVPNIRVIFKEREIKFQQEKYKINVIQTICSSYFWLCGWKLRQKAISRKTTKITTTRN